MGDAAGRADEIVITGAGMITCLGLDRHTTWEAVRQGQCGMGPLTAMEQALPAGKNGGQAPDLPPDDLPTAPREVRYLHRAIVDALRDAGIDPASLPCPPHRAGMMLGTTLHGMRAGGEYIRTDSTDPLADFLAASVLRSAGEGLALSGFSATTCSACSSALGAIALGVTLLREGKVDLIVAGGYDPISEYVYAGFNSLRLVADGPLKPFARDRQGMKLAEGYAIVILERAQDARAGGRQPIATILGFGESADAHHLTQPHPKGDGAARAVVSALRASGTTPADIDLIVAHATGTPDNDAGEYLALSTVFGADLPRVPVVGFKSHLGHTLGGAGAVELILAAMAMQARIVPPCANIRPGDSDFAGLNVAAGASKAADIRATLSLSLGFGGANTAMVLGPPPANESPRTGTAAGHRPSSKQPHDVLITGVGVLLPGAVGNQAFVELLQRPGATAPWCDTGPIPDEQISHLINARRVRRLSHYVKYTLAAAAMAFVDAGVTDLPGFGLDCAAVLGTTHGSTEYSVDYYSQIIRDGINAANPLLFAEGVPNAAAAHLSLVMSIKGACQTIIGARTAGLDALRLASARIAQGVWDRALVGAGEEYHETINNIYQKCRFAGNSHNVADATERTGGAFAVGCGAVMFVLESRESVEARGGRVLARVDACTSAAPGGSSPPEALRVIKELGPIDQLIVSRSGLWLDRVEERALRLAGPPLSDMATSLYGKVAECFSVGPFAGIAASILNGGITASGREAGKTAHTGVVATDVTGLISAARIVAE